MKNCEHVSCREFTELSRRNFLGVGGTSVAALLGAPLWLPRVTYAEERGAARDVLISVFLRGGADGLTLCVPHGDSHYYTNRPTLNIPRPDSSHPARAINLDGFFGVPQGMAALVPAYQAGDFAFVHACGSPDESRSHFDAMRYMEVGLPGADLNFLTGWLGRHLFQAAPMLPNAALRGVGLSPGLQQTLSGAPNTLPIADLTNFGINGWERTAWERLTGYYQSFRHPGDPLRLPVLNTLQTIRLLAAVNFNGYVPAGGAVYPDSDFGRALRSLSALIKADVGLEAAAVDLGGWDTHSDQQPRDGYMHELMRDLAQGLAALHADLIVSHRNVSVVVMSEFGRNVAENGSVGTDHGHGNLMMLMGGGIRGGQVYGQWPGLAPEQLYQEQDMQVTTDFRDILGEVLVRRLQTPNISEIFPGYTPVWRNVTR